MPLSQTDTALLKKSERTRFTELRNELSEDFRAKADRELIRSFLSLSEYKNASTLLMYYPVKGEANILDIANIALSEGKRVAFPVCRKETLEMDFFSVGSLSDLKKGSYGIPEPDGSCDIITDFNSTVCLVPALSFDRQGFRIGYGKGYYDRFLDKHPVYSAGLIYSPLLTDFLPTEETDKKVDVIITEKEVLPLK